MGESTDFGVLLIVGIVAVVAIISMSSTQRYAQPQVLEHNILEGPGADMPPYTELDYNGDGNIDYLDANILRSLARNNECVEDKQCDITGDGVVSNQDVARLTGLFVSAQQPAAQQPEAAPITGNTIVRPAYVPTGPSAGSSESISTILA